MDQTAAPEITFTPSVPLTESSSSWDSDFSYTARYDVAAGEALISNITITASTTARDLAGNLMFAYDEVDAFGIDILNNITGMTGLTSWTAYPNPVISGQDIRLNIPADVSDARVMIFDGQGKLVAD